VDIVKAGKPTILLLAVRLSKGSLNLFYPAFLEIECPSQIGRFFGAIFISKSVFLINRGKTSSGALQGRFTYPGLLKSHSFIPKTNKIKTIYNQVRQQVIKI
jgi:hypothetical protein